MTRKWQRVRLGDVISIKHGYAFRSEYFTDVGRYVVTTPGNFHEAGGFKFSPDKRKGYDGPIPEGFLLREDDLLVAMTEQAEGLLGATALVPVSGVFLHNQRLGLVKVDDAHRANKRFIYYLFNSISVRQQIRASASGTKVRHTSPSRIGEVVVSLPPLAEQSRIADILSKYDDLIENNTRRIAILEEMARRVFEEWFVHFRAPGCEGLPLVESAIGPIPPSWEVKRLDQIMEFDPNVRVPAGDNPFVPMTSLSTTSMIISGIERRDSRSGSKFRNDDTLLARITPCLENGKTGFVDFLDRDAIGIGSTEFVVMRGCSVPPTFVHLLARNRRFRDYAIKSMSGATGRQRVRRESLEQFQIAVPPDDMLMKFEKAVRPMFKLARALADQVWNLRAQRDLLLPKLISGEIDVIAASTALKEAAE